MNTNYKRTKLKWYTNDNGKEILERNESKGEKRISCVVTTKIQLTRNMKN